MANLGYPDPVGILDGETIDPVHTHEATLEYRCIYCANNSKYVAGQSVYVRDDGTRRFTRTAELPRCDEHGATFVSINDCYADVPGLRKMRG